MSDLGLVNQSGKPSRPDLRKRLLKLAASRGFQRWAARFPVTRGQTRREGEAMMDIVAGFVHSQCLQALIELRILPILLEQEQSADELAQVVQVPTDRLTILLKAGVALGLLRQSSGHYGLTLRGAALVGAPGLDDMVRHHSVLYRDLADPVAFFKGETETELAKFWPYVFGAGAAEDPDKAQRYSRLMADSQTLVAEETLASVSLSGIRHLIDVGGGTGAFLRHALSKNSELRATLFDLPAVVPAAEETFQNAGLSERITIRGGSFRDEDLPEGADAISLVRVLYDHSDETVAALLAKVYDALPSGGRLIISEPMSGGERPERAGDAYFSVYTLAMETGRTRSADEIGALLAVAGFEKIVRPRVNRRFITSVLTASKP